MRPGISAREYCFMPKQNELVPERTTSRPLCCMNLGPADGFTSLVFLSSVCSPLCIALRPCVIVKIQLDHAVTVMLFDEMTEMIADENEKGCQEGCDHKEFAPVCSLTGLMLLPSCRALPLGSCRMRKTLLWVVWKMIAFLGDSRKALCSRPRRR